MTKSIAAGAFKSRCLALLDEVARTGRGLVVTKRGRPVARVVPLEEPAPIDGSVVHCEELVSPAIDEEDWEMLRR
jgi:prevent-host-death family protein